MPGTDLTQFTPDPSAANAGMYVAVGTDKATGRAVIGLDAAAVDALTRLFDDLVNSDRYMYADNDDDRAAYVVALAVSRPLLKLQGFLS